MKALIALLLLTTVASAADLRTPVLTKAPVVSTALPTWTGFYLGGNVGYGADTTNSTVTAGTTVIDLGAVPRGPIAGGEIGYDFQPYGNLVLGLRADIDFANMRASGNVGTLSLNNLTNYIGDADLRLGYAGFGNHVLLYLDGGLAYGGRQPNLTVGSLQAAANDTSVGWNLGGGIETRLTQYVSAFGELDYYDLGGKSLQAGTLVTSNSPFRFGLAKLGLNIRN